MQKQFKLISETFSCSSSTITYMWNMLKSINEEIKGVNKRNVKYCEHINKAMVPSKAK